MDTSTGNRRRWGRRFARFSPRRTPRGNASRRGRAVTPRGGRGRSRARAPPRAPKLRGAVAAAEAVADATRAAILAIVASRACRRGEEDARPFIGLRDGRRVEGRRGRRRSRRKRTSPREGNRPRNSSRSSRDCSSGDQSTRAGARAVTRTRAAPSAGGDDDFAGGDDDFAAATRIPRFVLRSITTRTSHDTRRLAS